MIVIVVCCAQSFVGVFLACLCLCIVPDSMVAHYNGGEYRWFTYLWECWAGLNISFQYTTSIFSVYHSSGLHPAQPSPAQPSPAQHNSKLNAYISHPGAASTLS